MALIRLSTQAIPGSCTSDIIATNAVVGSHIAASAVVGSNIAPNAVVGSHISAAVVVGSHVVTNAIVGSHIAANAVVGSHISASVIVNSHIVDSTIAASKLGFTVPVMVFEEAPSRASTTASIYTLATAPTAYNVLLFLNGQKMQRVTAATDNTRVDLFYMASTGAVLFTAGVAPEPTDVVEATYAYSA